jgi:hypothetical protein
MRVSSEKNYTLEIGCHLPNAHCSIMCIRGVEYYYSITSIPWDHLWPSIIINRSKPNRSKFVRKIFQLLEFPQWLVIDPPVGSDKLGNFEKVNGCLGHNQPLFGLSGVM